jgi:hypothetical protein
MPQIIFECAATNLDTLLDSTGVLVGTSGYGIATLAPEDVATMRYVDTREPLSTTASRLKAGQISSVLINPVDPVFQYIFLHPPNAWGRPLSLWHQIIEYRGKNFLDHVGSLARVQGLRFISVSMEETIEITDAELAGGNFPWSKHNLILGISFREGRNGSREIRAGKCRDMPAETLRDVEDFVHLHQDQAPQ